MCRKLSLLGFLLVAVAGCTGGGSTCVDDPAARHHAQNPVSGACLEFESSCDIPDSWADCAGGCTNTCDPGSVRNETTCECDAVCDTTCEEPLLLDLDSCSCVESCPPVICDIGWEPAPAGQCGCVMITTGECTGDESCEPWQYCDFGGSGPGDGGARDGGSAPAPGAGGGSGGSDPATPPGEAPLLPVAGTCVPYPSCTYDSECGAGMWCQGGFADPGSGSGGSGGGSVPPSGGGGAPGFAPTPAPDAAPAEDRAPCVAPDGGGCDVPAGPGICTRGTRGGSTGSACFTSIECGAGDVCPAEAGFCGPAPTASEMPLDPTLPPGAKALVACNSTCTHACYGDGDCAPGFACSIPASSGGPCLIPSSGTGTGDVPAGGGGGAPAPPPCAGWCVDTGSTPTPPTDPAVPPPR